MLPLLPDLKPPLPQRLCKKPKNGDNGVVKEDGKDADTVDVACWDAIREVEVKPDWVCAILADWFNATNEKFLVFCLYQKKIKNNRE